jgi:ssDNA-binding Zn-finger/Zn-ribbon topoisomerase 1
MSEALVDREFGGLPEEIDPSDAFALLGNELRIDILRAMWAEDGGPIAFSELYGAVGVDDSAQFNYHLKKLTDHFVRHTDDGYELRHSGEKVIQAVLAGSFTGHPQTTIDTGDPCTQCGTELVAIYADEQLCIQCPECEHEHGKYSFPPGGLIDRTDEEVLRAFDQRVRHLHCLAKDGVCPECNGRMRTTIEREGDCCLSASVRVEHVCDYCQHSLCSALGLGLLDQSSVVAFYDGHGIDLAATPYWQLKWCVSDDPVTVRSHDPRRVAVDLTVDDDTMTVVLDEDLEITDTERPDISAWPDDPARS